LAPCNPEKLPFQSSALHLHQPLNAMLKKPTAQIAHLVFADIQANAEKPKELFFAIFRIKNNK
jgi:hypothetical protein